MKTSPDQLPLFEDRAFPERVEAGSLELERFRSEVKRAMSEAIRQCGLPRSVVAERMAAYLGLPKLSRATLDAYTAESKDTHDISLLRFAAFVHATSAPWLYDLIASKAGCTVLQGREARLAEMALLEQERRQINRKLAKLRAQPVTPARWRQRG